jgi:hypothetical protein
MQMDEIDRPAAEASRDRFPMLPPGPLARLVVERPGFGRYGDQCSGD